MRCAYWCVCVCLRVGLCWWSDYFAQTLAHVCVCFVWVLSVHDKGGVCGGVWHRRDENIRVSVKCAWSVEPAADHNAGDFVACIYIRLEYLHERARRVHTIKHAIPFNKRRYYGKSNILSLYEWMYNKSFLYLKIQLIKVPSKSVIGNNKSRYRCKPYTNVRAVPVFTRNV